MIRDFTPLRKKGYVVIKNFLNQDIVDKLKASYQATYDDYVANGATMKLYSVLSRGNKDTDVELVAQIKRLVGSACRQVLYETEIDADLIPSFYPTYMDNSLSPFDWHQDADTYFLWQNLFHSLNFYIPIIKPNPNKSGLIFVPMNVLKEKDLDFYNKYILNKGASSLSFKDNKTYYYSFEEDRQIELRYDMRSIAIAPELHEGDLLLLRGDVIHKTQDCDTRRVAISIRTCNRRISINKQRFYSGSQRKKDYINTNPQIYNEVHQYFKQYPEKDSMPIFANYKNEGRFGPLDGSY